MSETTKIRLLSFMYSALSMILVAVGGTILSPEFQALLRDYGVPTFWIAIITLAVTEGVKHLRNRRVLRNAPEFESASVGGRKRAVLI